MVAQKGTNDCGRRLWQAVLFRYAGRPTEKKFCRQGEENRGPESAVDGTPLRNTKPEALSASSKRYLSWTGLRQGLISMPTDGSPRTKPYKEDYHATVVVAVLRKPQT